MFQGQVTQNPPTPTPGGGDGGGDFNGGAGADAICASVAPSSDCNVPADARAFLSVDGTRELIDANDLIGCDDMAVPVIGAFTGDTLRAGGATAADGWVGFINNGPVAGETVYADALGSPVANVRIWTGSNTGGTVQANTCTGWTDNTAPPPRGRVGDSQLNDPTFINTQNRRCDNAVGGGGAAQIGVNLACICAGS